MDTNLKKQLRDLGDDDHGQHDGVYLKNQLVYKRYLNCCRIYYECSMIDKNYNSRVIRPTNCTIKPGYNEQNYLLFE